jgi:penicillin-binding protein 1C
MLLDRITPMRLAATLRSAGGTLTFPRRWTAPSLPMALGGVGITLGDLTMLYAGIPNGGMARPLVMRESETATETHRLFGAAAAWYLTDVLRGSALPPGFAMGQGLDRKRAIAFKTGTSYGFRDAWSLGFSDRYTIGVWAGRADGSTRVGRAGRNEAAPLLLKLFDLLPPEEPRNATPPQDVIVAAHADALPPALRRFSPSALPALTTRRGPPPPQIAFPPDGATVELVNDAEDGEAIALRAEGGLSPLRWIVNGEALPDAGRYETTYWTPDGEGWTRITVIDAEGRSATSVVRLKRRG